MKGTKKRRRQEIRRIWKEETRNRERAE